LIADGAGFVTTLVFGLILFLGTHSISIAAAGWRDRTVARIGEPVWKGMYALLSIAGFVLIVWGYESSRQNPVVLYVPPVGLKYLTLLLIIPVFPLLFAAYLPGRIQSAIGHPMFTAVMLWAIAHLLANGTLADILLFGSFLFWSIADRMSMIWREPRSMPSAPPSKLNDAIAIVAGLAVYAAFLFWLHRWLIGVPVLS
jgi:uncharacterized membrane protein